MAGTFNGTFFGEILVNGNLRKVGSKWDPFTLATSADVVLDSDVDVTAASGGQLLSTFGSVPLCVIVIPEVAGSLSWASVTETNNSAIDLRAGWPFILPTGTMPDYNTTTETRSEASSSNIVNIYFDADTDGQVRVIALR